MKAQSRTTQGLAALLAAIIGASGGVAAAHGRHRSGGVHHHAASARRLAYVGEAPVIQCVAFAKQDAGIEISGNARDWWYNAAGVYQRGQKPEAGSVLSFRPNPRMPLGHVAVVSSIEDSRTIVIDQSHWNSRGITRDVEVKDVSEDNDWSAVRVQLGRSADFGAIYPTHGFIYPRADQDEAAPASGRRSDVLVVAGNATLRTQHRLARSFEVAEAPDHGPGLDLSVQGLTLDAPNRAFR